LYTKKDDFSNMDWLAETMRRFSVAHLQKEPLSTVSMKNPMHVPKVRISSYKALCTMLLYSRCDSGRKKKYATAIKSGTKAKFGRLRVL
jgi:hypothetical protein